MDPFEEFEFKPLTDGLGFHKKKSTTPAKDTLSTKLFKEQGLELIDEPTPDTLRPPLPRKKSPASPLPQAPGGLTEVGGDGASQAVDEILKTLQKNRRLEVDKKTPKIETPTVAKEEFKTSSFNFSAATLDTMLVTATTLLCMIILLVVTKVDLIANLTNPDAFGMIYISTGALFATVSFMYLTLNRIYMGWTPGEWAFDQRVGKPDELSTTSYSLRVVARSLLVIVTGFIVFPILLAIFNKDFAGEITKAQLYKKA